MDKEENIGLDGLKHLEDEEDLTPKQKEKAGAALVGFAIGLLLVAILYMAVQIGLI